jgi:phage FluMu protein Com
MADLRDYRCERCKRLLFKAHLVAGALIEAQCPASRCKQPNTFELGKAKLDVVYIATGEHLIPDGIGGFVSANT